MLEKSIIIVLVTWFITLPFTLYFNYRLDRLIKMLDKAITDRPQ
jgi:uncharacterized protein (DUF2062 family)